MLLLIYPFLILAMLGFSAMLALHMAALAGSIWLFQAFGFKLFGGIFIVWIPTVFAMNRLSREFKQKDIWRAALRGCPNWMRKGLWWLWGYAFFAAFALPLLSGGGEQSPESTARSMSAIALVFYSTAACVLFSASRVDKVDAGRQCINGHRVSPLARFCEA